MYKCNVLLNRIVSYLLSILQTQCRVYKLLSAVMFMLDIVDVVIIQVLNIHGIYTH